MVQKPPSKPGNKLLLHHYMTDEWSFNFCHHYITFFLLVNMTKNINQHSCWDYNNLSVATIVWLHIKIVCKCQQNILFASFGYIEFTTKSSVYFSFGKLCVCSKSTILVKCIISLVYICLSYAFASAVDQLPVWQQVRQSWSHLSWSMELFNLR